MLNRKSRGPLCWVMAFFTASYQHLLWTPIQSGAPSPFGLVWLSLPQLVYNSVRSLTATSVLTESYYSPTPTQSPTGSLESHDWSSLSRNNCHAVHRSLSSGASVYECTMGISLPRPISSHNCHWNVSLPSGASLWMAFLAGSKAKIQHNLATSEHLETIWSKFWWGNSNFYIVVANNMVINNLYIWYFQLFFIGKTTEVSHTFVEVMVNYRNSDIWFDLVYLTAYQSLRIY